MTTLLFIPSQKGFDVFKINDILYVKGCGSYSEIYFSNGGSKKTVSFLLRKIENQLKGANFNFYRIHKSFLINAQYIKEYRNTREKVLLMQDDTKIPVATRRREAFCDWCKSRFSYISE